VGLCKSILVEDRSVRRSDCKGSEIDGHTLCAAPETKVTGFVVSAHVLRLSFTSGVAARTNNFARTVLAALKRTADYIDRIHC